MQQRDRAFGVKPRGRRIGLILTGISIVLLLILAGMPSPYVIERPGPVFNTLGTSATSTSKTKVPVVTISGRTTYPTTGRLDMLTVSVVGNPDGTPNWAEILQAWIDPTQSVVPLTAVFPAGETTDQSAKENAAAMAESQENATAAAFTNLGIPYTVRLDVSGFIAGSKAQGVLEKGDRLTKVNGVALTSIEQLQSAVGAAGAGKAIPLTIVRAGATHTVDVPTITQGGQRYIGVLIDSKFAFPYDVKISLTDVGGPSAGSMFALAIVDKLTPGPLTGGQHVAGTGTITPAGTVGPIGGIQQKMVAARRAGAEWFLAPTSNCSEVTGHVPDGLQVVSVSTLGAAVSAVKQIAVKQSVAGLASCPR